MNFTLICGISSAGTTTYSKQFDNVIHLDDYRSFHACNNEVSKITNDTYLEGVYITKQMRMDLLKKVPEGFHKKCIFLNTSLDEALRCKLKYRADKLMIEQSKILEPPTYDEGWDEIVTIDR